MRHVAAAILVGLCFALGGPVQPAPAVASSVLYAYTANQNANTVSVVDTGANAVVATIPVGCHPQGRATPSGQWRSHRTGHVST